MGKKLITICGRGGSKGVKLKNIREVGGIPLIVYSIRSAQSLAKEIDADIFLSTESEEIKAVAAEFGLETDYVRPEELATDTAGKIDVLADALKYAEEQNGISYSHLIDLDVSSPLRTKYDVLSALKMLEDKEDALNIFSVSEARKNPYFNMVEKNESGFYSLSKDGSVFLTRQSATEVLELNASFYIYSRTFFEEGCKSAITERSLAFKMDHICFDVDNEMEMYFLEYLINENKLSFEL